MWTEEKLRLSLANDTPYSTALDFHWPGYDFIKHRMYESSTNYTHTGSFSKIVAYFYIKRRIAQFLLSVYAPITMFVFLSWGSFWIEIPAAPARVSLGVTVLLTMVTRAQAINQGLPSLPYIHGLDIWIMVCTIFVFATIIEYIAVNYIYFSKKRYRLKIKKRSKSMIRHRNQTDRQFGSLNDISTVDIDPNYFPTNGDSLKGFKNGINAFRRRNSKQLYNQIKKFLNFHKRKKTWERRNRDRCEEIACEIDRMCRIIFPLFFFLFNVIYWIILLCLSNA